MEKAYRESEPRSAAAASTEPILVWKVHLLRENPTKILLILPIVLVSLLVCFVVFRSLLFAAVILFLFTSAFAEFIFPIRYEISSRGASARSLFSRSYIEWDRVKKYYLDDSGIKLSPLSYQSRLEAYRGVYLRFGDHEAQVVNAVRRMRDALRTTDGSTD